MADNLEVGTLSGRIELEDRLGPAVAEINNKLDILNEKFSQSHGSALKAAEGYLGAELALEGIKKGAELVTDAIKELTIQGSHASDIEDTFHRLTDAAGIAGDTLKTKLSTALHGTVDDTDLMVRVNQNLSTGLKLTTDQYETMAKGAFALAKATGGNAAEALDKLSDAMVTGRVRSIQLLTGKIDLAAAEDKFAAKLGTTADRLSEEGKQAAIQEAILNKVKEATERVGDQQERLADKIARAQVNAHNFVEELGMSIANSPKVIKAYDDIEAALNKAFGNDKGALIDTITDKVGNLAESSASAAKVVIEGLVKAKDLWNEYFSVIEGGAVVLGTYYTAQLVLTGAMEAYKVTLAAVKVLTMEVTAATWAAQGGLIAAAAALGAFVGYKLGQLQPISDFFQGLALRIEGYSSAEVDAMIATDHATQKATESFNPLLDAQEKSKKAAEQQSIAAQQQAESQREAAEATAKQTEEQRKQVLILSQTREEAKKYADALKEINFITGDWKKVLEEIDDETVQAVKFYLDAGVALDKLATAYGLTDTQAKAIQKDWQIGNETIKSQIAVAKELSDAWLNYYSELSDLVDSDLTKANKASLKKYNDLIQKLQDAGDAEVDHYNSVWKLYEKDVEKNAQALLLNDQNTKASLNKRIQDQQAYIDFIIAHQDQYTTSFLKQQQTILTGLQKQKDAWGQVGTSIDKDTKLVAGYSDAVMEANRVAGGQFDVTSANFQQQAESFGLNYTNALKLAKLGYSFQEIVQLLRGQGSSMPVPLPAPHGPRIPGFKDGGIGDFGPGTLAMLHGREAVVPLDKSGAAGLGGIQINFNGDINGDGRAVANEVKQMLMTELRMSKQFSAF